MKSLQLDVPEIIYQGPSIGGFQTDWYAVPPKARYVLWGIAYEEALTAEVALHARFSEGGNEHIDFNSSGISFFQQIITSYPFVSVHTDTIDEDVPITITLLAKSQRG
jgi:hypothetical protein